MLEILILEGFSILFLVDTGFIEGKTRQNNTQ
jgi:hypothetical protein